MIESIRKTNRSPIARRRLRGVVALLLLLYALPVGVSAAVNARASEHWFSARRDASGLAPDPETTPEAVLQVYAARTFGWRGVLAVHTWIAVKPTGSPRYSRYEVMGFGVGRGAPALRVDRQGPDNYWVGNRPEVLLDRRGAGVDALIERVRAAVLSYPYPDHYRSWPGPNSNTFTAHVIRSVPELGFGLPANAIGKDYLTNGSVIAASPSGTGLQLSVFGLLGVMVAANEGLEVNLLGLTFGLDATRPAVKLPGIGRVGMERGTE